MILKLGEKFNNETVFVKCYSAARRGGFSHNATAVLGNGEVLKAKVNYVNRTWECYPFQTVLRCFCEKLAVALYNVPNASALRKSKKWEEARDFEHFLAAQV